MKIGVLFLFVLTTTIGTSVGQTTTAPTDCAKRVAKCWSDQQTTMTKADANLDLLTGCKAFKTYVDCYVDVLQDYQCTKDPSVVDENNKAFADRNGLCLGDGTLDQCGYSVQACFNDVQDIRNSYTMKNITLACPVMAKFNDCSTQVDSSTICGNNVKTVLDDIKTELFETSLLSGCDGACGMKIGKCLGNLTDIFINGDFFGIDWKAFCRDAYAQSFCLENLRADVDCSNDPLTNLTLNGQESIIKGYCDGDGKPALCIDEIKACTTDWRIASTNATISLQCQAAMSYLMCTSKVSCAVQLKDLLVTLRNNIETVETKDNCPLVGTCKERLAACNNLQAEVNRTSTPELATQYCIAVETANRCFTTIRSDTMCATETDPKSDFEISLLKNTNTPCPAFGTNDCVKRVTKCWSDQQATMNKADANLDLVTGCKAFRMYVDCYVGVLQDSQCTKDPGVVDENNKAFANRNGLCLGDGTLDQCGSAIQVCFNDVQDIKNSYTAKNLTVACPVIAKFNDCSTQVPIGTICGDNVKTILDNINVALLQTSLLSGCDGACGMKVGNCLGNLTDIMINGDLLTMDWKAFCVDAYTGIGCVANLTSDVNCSNDPLTKQMLNGQNTILKDYCDGDGKPALCIDEIKACTNDWRISSTNVTIDLQCQAAWSYLMCTSKVSCAVGMKDLLMNLRNDIETVETKDNCPLVGTCKERLAACNNLQAEVNRTSAQELAAQFCSAVETAKSCFTVIRGDTVCATEADPKSDFETSLLKNTITPCPGCTAVCYGQSTTTFHPTSACGIGAQKCYSDQEDVINNKFEGLDFAGGCQIYKSMLTCMTTGDCSTDSDVKVIRQKLDDIQMGICGADGSVEKCGLDVHVCLTEMEQSMADLLIKNITNACQLIVKFISCANNVTGSNECSASLTSKVKQVQKTMTDDQSTIGCYGPCAQAVALCTNGAATMPTNLSNLTLELKTFCRSASTVNTCLKNPTTTAVCSSPQSYFTTIVQNELSKIGDICTIDGSITPCVTSLIKCDADFKGIPTGSNISAQCTASSLFLECIDTLSCASSLAPLIASFKNSTETEEIGRQCPIVGSCKERFVKCGLRDQFTINNINKEAVCSTAAVTFACFDNVKKDPVCVKEKDTFTTDLQNFYTVIDYVCNQSGATVTGSTTTTFVPTSVCGIGASKCLSAQYDVMEDRFNSLDYTSACRYFKSIALCMERLGDCSMDSDFIVVHQQLLNDMDGICGTDGSVNSCGRDINTCYTAMDAAVIDLLNKNFSNACPLLINFTRCANIVINMNECPKSVTEQVKEIQKTLNTDQIINCDGPCPKAIESCIGNATNLPIDESILTTDLSEYCRSSSKVYNCLNTLMTSALCSTSAVLTYLKNVVQNELTKVGDVCNADGSTSACVKTLIECSADLVVGNYGTDTTSVCKAKSEYAECISELPCASSLVPLIANFRNKTETDEIQHQCPTIGSCNERWTKCGQQEQGLITVPSSEKEQICKTAVNGIKCFNSVKADSLCINEENHFISQFQSLNMVINIQCGNGAKCFVQLPLFVAALLISLKQYF